MNLIDNDVAKGSNLIFAKVAANLLGVETGPRIASRKHFFLRRSARTKQGSHFIDQGRIVAEGGKELALELEAKGYEHIVKEPA